MRKLGLILRVLFIPIFLVILLINIGTVSADSNFIFKQIGRNRSTEIQYIPSIRKS